MIDTEGPFATRCLVEREPARWGILFGLLMFRCIQLKGKVGLL
jgi:hypothetical protein